MLFDNVGHVLFDDIVHMLFDKVDHMLFLRLAICYLKVGHVSFVKVGCA